MNATSKNDTRHLIKLVNACSAPHNVVGGCHFALKPWLSIENLISLEINNNPNKLNSDDYLSPNLVGHPEGAHPEEVYEYQFTFHV